MHAVCGDAVVNIDAPHAFSAPFAMGVNSLSVDVDVDVDVRVEVESSPFDAPSVLTPRTPPLSFVLGAPPDRTDIH